MEQECKRLNSIRKLEKQLEDCLHQEAMKWKKKREHEKISKKIRRIATKHDLYAAYRARKLEHGMENRWWISCLFSGDSLSPAQGLSDTEALEWLQEYQPFDDSEQNAGNEFYVISSVTTEELGRFNYREIEKGIFVAPGNGRVLFVQPGDTAILVVKGQAAQGTPHELRSVSRRNPSVLFDEDPEARYRGKMHHLNMEGSLPMRP